MSLLHKQLKQPKEQLLQCWTAIDNTTTLGDEESCIVYTPVLQHYGPAVGSEALSLISYARKFTDPPRYFNSIEIADVLYESPVPSGRLPLDMPVADFVREAEDRLREMPVRQHFACSLFKRRLLQCMELKFADQPEFRLFYARTLL